MFLTIHADKHTIANVSEAIHEYIIHEDVDMDELRRLQKFRDALDKAAKSIVGWGPQEIPVQLEGGIDLEKK